MADHVAPADLVVGVSYDVHIQDCCVDASFTSVLKQREGGDYPALWFENGVYFPDTYQGAVHFTQMET